MDPTSHPNQQSSTIFVKVVPGASRDRVAGRYADGIKVQVCAPPERGKANAAVASVLAGFFGVRPSQIELISAPSIPRKQFRINGISPRAAAQRIDAL